jgi:hypothetical protein
MSRTMPLEVIRVEEPCKADWDAMTGDAARRFCAGCQKHVHNLSAMPREEAERLVCESAGHLCVRFETAVDGQVVTLDYGPRARIRGGWKLWTLVGFIGAALASAAHALTGTKPVAPRTPPIMGDMVAVRMTPPSTRPVPMGRIACPVVPPPAPQQPLIVPPSTDEPSPAPAPLAPPAQ